MENWVYAAIGIIIHLLMSFYIIRLFYVLDQARRQYWHGTLQVGATPILTFVAFIFWWSYTIWG